MINTKNARNESKTELLENGKKCIGEVSKEILSNKNEETLFTQSIQQLLRSSCSWVDFNLGCQIREMLGFPRAVLKNLLFLGAVPRHGEMEGKKDSTSL